MELKSKYLTSGLKCPDCGSIGFDSCTTPEQSLVCKICAARFPFDDGVIRMDGAVPKNSVSTFSYDTLDGSHFVGTTFESNPLIYITSRAYCRFLGELGALSIETSSGFRLWRWPPFLVGS